MTDAIKFSPSSWECPKTWRVGREKSPITAMTVAFRGSVHEVLVLVREDGSIYVTADPAFLAGSFKRIRRPDSDRHQR